MPLVIAVEAVVVAVDASSTLQQIGYVLQKKFWAYPLASPNNEHPLNSDFHLYYNFNQFKI